MLIGIDASRAFVPSPTGTEIYSRQVTRWLLALGSAHRFRLYFRSEPPAGAFAGAERRVMPFPRLWTHVRLSLEMARRPPDVLFVPAHVLPLVHPRASVVTVHDLGYLRFPGLHPPGQRLYLDISTRWSARAASHLLADSKATKADLVARYGVPQAKVSVAYPGIDEGLQPIRDKEALEAVKVRYGIAGDYLIHLGTLQPRKNLARLVAAYAGLGTHAPRLVLAGKRGWGYRELLTQVNCLGLAERVLFPGYVDPEDRAALLSGAVAFVFPSLYEGFGMPVLEAQACRCPVIASNTSSLPEVAGDAALLTDPLDVLALRGALQRLIGDRELRRILVGRGAANVLRFSWRACAERILSAMEAGGG